MPNYHAFLDCKNPKCRHPMLLPYSKPQQTSHDLVTWPRDDWRRTFLCLSCRHVCAYTAGDVQWWISPLPDPPELSNLVVACKRFRCEQQNCGTLIEVFAVVDRRVPIEEQLAIVWIFSGVRCSQEHPVTYDPDVLMGCPPGTSWL